MNSVHDVTRRGFLAATGALAAGALLPPTLAAAADAPAGTPLGEWIEDGYGLPAYHYTGPLRFPDSPVEGGERMLPDDPFFLTGNYRLTVFTHASGAAQLLTGERAWGRLNQGPQPFSGAHQASVALDLAPPRSSDGHDAPHVHGTHRIPLIGVDAAAAQAATKRCGVGFARYDYRLTPELSVSRQLSVAPSAQLGQGASAFLVQVRLRNTGQQPLSVHYEETMLARYNTIFARWDEDQKKVDYAPAAPVSAGGYLLVHFTPHPRHRLAFPPAGQMCRLEPDPPALFVRAMDTESRVLARNESTETAALHSWIGVQAPVTLQPGKDHTLAFVIGYTRDDPAVDALIAQLAPAAPLTDTLGSAFGRAWAKVVPGFEKEHDPVLRREMRWNAAVLEQMATWREYYDETVLPQGTVYDYTWGMVGAMRDQAQHALPFCHFHAAIARSTLRFIMKRTLPDGDILLSDAGFGWSPATAQQTSDQQLFFFLLLAEYLRVTGDTSVLTEPVGYYPLENSGRDTGFAHVRQMFLFLRERIGTGPHGLVLRWNSDWNDMFGWWPSAHPYNSEFTVSESHMNSAMAVVVLEDLAKQLEGHASALGSLAENGELIAALREYRNQIQQAFVRDLGSRAFPRRAWLWTDDPLGEDSMWLEPQGFTLLISDLGVERKRRLYAELKKRLLAGEALGPRQIEKPVVEPGTPQGSRENGGFWYALNGPVILGLASFDRAAAEDLLRRMTFDQFARSFPRYWTGLWTASDALDSSLLATNGLSQNIPWCAHAHAWPLYCWLRLREARS